MAEGLVIPFYDMRPDPSETSGTGVYCVSLVDDPAIRLPYVALSSLSKQDSTNAAKAANAEALAKFAAVTPEVGEYKGYVVGPLLVPDFPIFRLTDEGRPYFIQFSKESIVQIRDKFFKTHSHRSTNMQHSKPLGGNTIVESQIVDDGNKSYWDSVMGYDVPVGAWMAKMKIEDRDFFEKEILGKNLIGFSIEGWFDYIEITDEVVKTSKAGESLSQNRNSNSMKNPLFKLVLSLFGKGQPEQFKKHELEDGSMVIEIEETKEPFKLDANANEIGENPERLADGDYKLMDGTTMVVASGKVTEIKPAETTTDPAVDATVEAMCATLGITVDAYNAACAKHSILSRAKSEKFSAPKIKLGASAEQAKLAVVIDSASSKPMFVDQGDGRISYIEDNGGYLWTGDHVPAGSYTLADGSILSVVEKTEIRDEGTQWEYTYTCSYVDFEASTVAPETLIPWLKKAASPLAELSAIPTVAKLQASMDAKDRTTVQLSAKITALEAEVKALKATPAADPVVVNEGAVNASNVSKAVDAVSRAAAFLGHKGS